MLSDIYRTEYGLQITRKKALGDKKGPDWLSNIFLTIKFRSINRYKIKKWLNLIIWNIC